MFVLILVVIVVRLLLLIVLVVRFLLVVIASIELAPLVIVVFTILLFRRNLFFVLNVLLVKSCIYFAEINFYHHLIYWKITNKTIAHTTLFYICLVSRDLHLKLNLFYFSRCALFHFLSFIPPLASVMVILYKNLFFIKQINLYIMRYKSLC